MTKQELEDKIVSLLIDYIREHKEFRLREFMHGCTMLASTLVVMMNNGILSKAARCIFENRTTLVERFRIKGELAENERIALAKKHNVKYVSRTVNRKEVLDFYATYREQKELQGK